MPEPFPSPGLDLAVLDRRFRHALLAFFVRRLGNHAEAEDLTQEVFYRLARAEGRNLQNAEAYIFQIAANLLRDRGRQSAFRNRQNEAITAAEHRRGDAPDAERILIGKDNLHSVIQVLNGLSQKTRDIFILNRLEGLTHKELADMFGISPSAIGQHIYKASALLAKKLGQTS